MECVHGNSTFLKFIFFIINNESIKILINKLDLLFQDSSGEDESTNSEAEEEVAIVPNRRRAIPVSEIYYMYIYAYISHTMII